MVDLPLMQAMLAALPARSGAASGRRRRPAAADRPGAGAGRPDRLGPPAGRAADRDLPPGRGQPDRAERPSRQSRADAGAGSGGRAAVRLAIKARGPEDGARLLELVTERIPNGSASIRWRRHPGPVPDQPRRARRAPSQPDAAGGAQSPTPDRLEHHGVSFALGDKVMQLENDYDREVYNGDRPGAADRPRAEPGQDRDRRPPAGYACRERAGRAGAGVRDHRAQGAGLRYLGGRCRSRRHYAAVLRRNWSIPRSPRASALVLVVEGNALELAIAQRPEPRRWSRLRELLRA